MMNVDLNLMGKALAQEVSNNLLGAPTENRVIIAVNTSERKAGGLYVPDQAKEDIPRKGVVIKKGVTNDDQDHANLKIGDVVSFGIYGGKEIYPTFMLPQENITGIKFYVLSSSEIIYVEPNTKA